MTTIPYKQVAYVLPAGILKDMAQLYDIYKLVKTADKIALKEEKANPEETVINGHYIHVKPNVFVVKRKFTNPHRWFKARSALKVHDTTNIALQEGYLKQVHSDSQLRELVFEIPLKGHNLIQRSLFNILPKGLLLAWADKNNTFASLVFGFFGGIVIGTIGIVIAVYK